MTPEEQRIAIAEKCGKAFVPPPEHIHVNNTAYKIAWMNSIPDYCNDLNAMQSAVLSQPIGFVRRFQTALSYRSSRTGKLFCQLTACDWAEEFIEVQRDEVK